MIALFRVAVVVAAATLLQFSCVPSGIPTPTPTPTPSPNPTPNPNPSPNPNPNPQPPVNGAPTQSFVVSGEQGFNRGTVYYPTSGEGPFGAIIVAPGFTEPESAVAWMGPYMASRGFVTMTLEMFTTGDLPAQRGQQLVAARTYLTAQAGNPASPLSGVFDPSRYAYSGHSMGGGGSLEAARLDPGASALIPLTAWNLGPDFSDVSVPTLIVACQGDAIAPNGQHSDPMYASLSGPKSYMLATGGHFCSNTGAPETGVIGKYGADFLRTYLNNDTAARQNLCAGPKPDLLDYRTTIC